MKKTLFILLTLSLWMSEMAFSQKVKVKKDEIQIDGISVAKIEKNKAKDIYIISTLDGTPKFTADLKIRTKKGNFSSRTENRSWIEITNIQGDKMNEFWAKGYSFTFSTQRGLAENLVLDDLKLIDEKGPNDERVNAFLEAEKSNIAKGIDIEADIIKAEKARRDSIYNIEKEKDNFIAQRDKLSVSRDGKIYAKGEEIGHVSRIELKDSDIRYKYAFADMDNYVLAKMEYPNNTTLDGNYLTITTETKENFYIKPFYINEDLSRDGSFDAVKKLYANGITFGKTGSMLIKQRAQEELIEREKKTAQAKQESRNFYNKKGYLIEENGTKHEGLITVEFQSIDKMVNPNSGISDATTYATFLVLLEKDKFGKDKKNVYKAKDNISFCLDDEGKEACFMSMSEISNSVSTVNNALSLRFTNKKFYQIFYEKDGNYILVDRADVSDYYYIKLKNQAKGLYLTDQGFMGKKSPEKIEKSFQDYFICPALKSSDYDYKSLDSLKKLLDDYVGKCK